MIKYAKRLIADLEDIEADREAAIQEGAAAISALEAADRRCAELQDELEAREMKLDTAEQAGCKCEGECEKDSRGNIPVRLKRGSIESLLQGASVSIAGVEISMEAPTVNRTCENCMFYRDDCYKAEDAECNDFVTSAVWKLCNRMEGKQAWCNDRGFFDDGCKPVKPPVTGELFSPFQLLEKGKLCG